MDPISQGVLGGIAACSFAKQAEMRPAIIAGILGGMAADLDVLIRSDEDPLLFLDYHRHFTHSLLFVPLGALLVAGFCWLFLRRFLPFRRLYLFAFLGYGTHGLLDACTTYGTLLYWPFSSERVAWSLISIIDPAFTVPLILFACLGFFRRNRIFGLIAIVWAALYLSFGRWQHDRTIQWIDEIALVRGDRVSRVVAHPSIGNLLLWRTLYETKEGKIVIDAVRQGILVESQLFEGGRMQGFELNPSVQGMEEGSRLWRDIERFYYFSDGWIAQPAKTATGSHYILGDLRYGMLPDDLNPLWGIEVRPHQSDDHARFLSFRQVEERDFSALLRMLRGKSDK